MLITSSTPSENPPTDHDITPEELYANPQWGRSELVDGRVIQMDPAGDRHGQVVMELTMAVCSCVEVRQLGHSFAAGTGFIYPDRRSVLAPDLMVLLKSRVPADLPDEGYLPVVPDFAAEVVSFDETLKTVVSKAESYLSVGIRLVWVIDPGSKLVYVYRPGEPVLRKGIGERLDGGGVIIGLDIPVDVLF